MSSGSAATLYGRTETRGKGNARAKPLYFRERKVRERLMFQALDAASKERALSEPESIEMERCMRVLGMLS